MTRTISAVIAVLVLAWGGWAWSASGRSSVVRAMQTVELREALDQGHAAVLEMRVDVHRVQLREAKAELEIARASLRRAHELLEALGRIDEAARLQTVLAGLDDAARLTASLDRDATTRAAQTALTVR